MERAQPSSLGFEDFYADEFSSMAFEERRYCVLGSLYCLPAGESDSVALAALTPNTDHFGKRKRGSGIPRQILSFALNIPWIFRQNTRLANTGSKDSGGLSESLN